MCTLKKGIFFSELVNFIEKNRGQTLWYHHYLSPYHRMEQEGIFRFQDFLVYARTNLNILQAVWLHFCISKLTWENGSYAFDRSALSLYWREEKYRNCVTGAVLIAPSRLMYFCDMMYKYYAPYDKWYHSVDYRVFHILNPVEMRCCENDEELKFRLIREKLFKAQVREFIPCIHKHTTEYAPL